MNGARALQSAAEAAHPSLPPDICRADVERMIRRCGGAFGLSRGTVSILIDMMGYTRPRDWTGGAAAPVCFAAQTRIAEASNRSTRTIRNAEVELEKAGLILRRVGNGGQRGRWGDFALGIDFSPLIARVEDLRRIYDERIAREARAGIVRKQISAARRLVRTAVEELAAAAPDHPSLSRLQSAIADWPRRYGNMPLGMLEALLRNTETLYRNAASALQMSPDISGLSDKNDRPLQDNIEDQTCSCTTRNAPGMQVGRDQDRHEGMCTEEHRERPARSAVDTLATLTPANLYGAATPEFRLYLDGYSRGIDPDPLAFVEAAIRRCTELEVGGTAWDEACKAMGGPFAAALAVLVIDARRLDPARPVHSPGGILRAMSRCAAAGTLNLAGSLIALTRRSDRALEPQTTIGALVAASCLQPCTVRGQPASAPSKRHGVSLRRVASRQAWTQQ